MHTLPDYLKEPLVDPLAASPYAISQAKVGDTRSTLCRVISYDQISHTAVVLPLDSGPGPGITVRVGTDQQGTLTGTGTASALKPNNLVLVDFSGGHMGGVGNTGVARLAPYTPVDQKAPVYAPWHQSGTGTVTVHSTPDGGYGNARHEAEDSTISETQVGDHHIHHMSGSVHSVHEGPNITRAEQQQRQAADILALHAAKLSLRP